MYVSPEDPMEDWMMRYVSQSWIVDQRVRLQISKSLAECCTYVS